MCRHGHRHASRAFTTLDTGIHFILHHVLKIIHSFICRRFYVKVFAVNAKGRSAAVTMKTSTVKETSRLPLLPPEQSEDSSMDFYAKIEVLQSRKRHLLIGPSPG